MKQYNGLWVNVLFSMILVSAVSAHGQDTDKPCISVKDYTEVSQNFKQVADLAVKEKTQYCEADLGANWYQIVHSLVTLKNMKPNAPSEKVNDAFTYKAIQEKDWWAYFTARAKSFAIQETCEENVVAYVMSFFNTGEVNLCPPFFKENVTSQASTLMHEVRHFDGFRHITCTRGQDKGSSGACDKDIHDRGSYAITVQTLVSMARTSTIPKEQKPLVEAEAVYMAFNRFNVLPALKVTRSVILSSKNGDVYKWTPGEQMEQVASLAQPARVYVGYNNNMTIYPTDASADAYRLDSTFKNAVPSIGLFAVTYNSLSPEVRKQYDSITYLAMGGLIKNNTLTTNCGGEGVIEEDLSKYGKFTRFITLSSGESDFNPANYIVGKSGDVLTFKCTEGNSSSIDIAKAPLTLSPSLAGNIEDMFPLGSQVFALLTNGTLVQVAVSNNQISQVSSAVPIPQGDWLSSSPVSKAEVFNQ